MSTEGLRIDQYRLGQRTRPSCDEAKALQETAQYAAEVSRMKGPGVGCQIE